MNDWLMSDKTEAERHPKKKSSGKLNSIVFLTLMMVTPFIAGLLWSRYPELVVVPGLIYGLMLGVLSHD